MLPVAAAAVLAAGSGVLMDLAFPATGWWPLAPVAVAALVVALHGRRAGAGAGLGFLHGLGFFVPHLGWSGTYVGALPWLALSTLQAGYLALMGAAVALVLRGPGGPVIRSLGVAGLWVAQEGLRGRVPFGGFPWGRVAFSQADAPTAALASLAGMPFVTFVVVLAGALLAHAVLAAVLAPSADLAPSSRSRLTPALAGAAGVLMVFGLAVPVPAGAGGGDGQTVQVAAVQGNVPRPGLEFNAERRAVLDNHADATRQLAQEVAAGRAAQPDLVLWPENSSDIDPFRNEDAAEVISSAVDAVAAPVLVGTVLREPADRLSNAAVVWSPGSGPGERYVKRRPAPFAEYIPYRSFFRLFSDKVDLVRTDFTAGEEVGVLSMGPATVGDVICFEVVFDDLVRDTVLAGADVVVVQTNNATFGYTDESVQQLAMSRLRAIEHGRSVVHISTVGVSALVAPDGSVQEQSGHFTQEVLTGALELREELTPATRLGAAPELVLAAGGVALLLAALLLGRRHRRGTA